MIPEPGTSIPYYRYTYAVQDLYVSFRLRSDRDVAALDARLKRAGERVWRQRLSSLPDAVVGAFDWVQVDNGLLPANRQRVTLKRPIVANVAPENRDAIAKHLAQPRATRRRAVELSRVTSPRIP